MSKQYKKYGMTLHLIYKNKKVKEFINVICFNLIDGDILIWLCYKVRPLVRKMKYIKDFYCSYTRY